MALLKKGVVYMEPFNNRDIQMEIYNKWNV